MKALAWQVILADGLVQGLVLSKLQPVMTVSVPVGSIDRQTRVYVLIRVDQARREAYYEPLESGPGDGR